MAYSDFKLPDLKRRFQLTIGEDADLFSHTHEDYVSERLRLITDEPLKV
jgi:hypothetical protein